MGRIDDIDIIRKHQTGRYSSWDTTGANGDSISIPAGQSRVIADITGPGKITHLWLTQQSGYRDCLLKITWNNASYPSVLCPLGDFFCLGNSIVNTFENELFAVSTRFPHRFEEGAALNSYVPMRFSERAVVEIVNDGSDVHRQFFYVDYETWDLENEEHEHGYFHAEFRRCNPFGGWGSEYTNPDVHNFPNTERCAWENNYVILDTRGRGHFVGCNLSVTNLRGDWWGEGDDMVWIDGYKWPPDLHGTGTEDFFNQAWGMNPAAHTGTVTSRRKYRLLRRLPGEDRYGAITMESGLSMNRQNAPARMSAQTPSSSRPSRAMTPWPNRTAGPAWIETGPSSFSGISSPSEIQIPAEMRGNRSCGHPRDRAHPSRHRGASPPAFQAGLCGLFRR